MKFSCPRTCPQYGSFWCRFRPILDGIGPVQVNSHTAKIVVEFRDPETLRLAIEAMGGKWLGHGTHKLYSSSHEGHGFTLQGWRFPIVLEAGNRLAFDNYNGAWGDVSQLDRLKGEYALSTAQAAAQAQGWLCERNSAGLTVHHPQGGTITVTASGEVDAIGFMGQGCHDAIMALGQMTDMKAKPEYTQVQANIRTT